MIVDPLLFFVHVGWMLNLLVVSYLGYVVAVLGKKSKIAASFRAAPRTRLVLVSTTLLAFVAVPWVFFCWAAVVWIKAVR